MTAQTAMQTALAGATPYLSVNNVEVIYDHVILVLKGVSLDVPEGKIVALLGANGAGKSTTLKSISTLLKGERGERKGKYMLLVEIESLAARDRYAPDSGPSAEMEELNRQAAPFWERWRELATVPGDDTVFTDYVVIQ